MLDVKILDYPTHAAIEAGGDDPELRGHAPRAFRARRLGRRVARAADLARWPDVRWTPSPTARRVDLDTLTPAEVAQLEARRDACCCRARCSPAATPRTSASRTCSRKARTAAGVDFTNRVIYYVGPVDPVRDEVVGPAGPTTATRMDKFTEMMLAQDRPRSR